MEPPRVDGCAGRGGGVGFGLAGISISVTIILPHLTQMNVWTSGAEDWTVAGEEGCHIFVRCAVVVGVSVLGGVRPG